MATVSDVLEVSELARMCWRGLGRVWKYVIFITLQQYCKLCVTPLSHRRTLCCQHTTKLQGDIGSSSIQMSPSFLESPSDLIPTVGPARACWTDARPLTLTNSIIYLLFVAYGPFLILVTYIGNNLLIDTTSRYIRTQILLWSSLPYYLSGSVPLAN
jgi:hypothetical protein